MCVSLGRVVEMIETKFDWSSFPCYTIHIKDISAPVEISHIFKKYQIDKYVYRIKFKGIVLKFGMSAAESEYRDWGERLYRQVAHCSTWGEQRIDGSSGSDWLTIERDVKEAYGLDLDHTGLVCTVWDVGSYNFESYNPRWEVEKMEAELIDCYVSISGEKPIGNINDHANARNRAYVKKETFEPIFTIEH